MALLPIFRLTHWPFQLALLRYWPSPIGTIRPSDNKIGNEKKMEDLHIDWLRSRTLLGSTGMSEGEPGGADGRPPSRQPGRRVRRSEPNVSSHHGSQEELHASAQSKPLDVKMTVQMAAAAVAEAPAAECSSSSIYRHFIC